MHISFSTLILHFQPADVIMGERKSCIAIMASMPTTRNYDWTILTGSVIHKVMTFTDFAL